MASSGESAPDGASLVRRSTQPAAQTQLRDARGGRRGKGEAGQPKPARRSHVRTTYLRTMFRLRMLRTLYVLPPFWYLATIRTM